MPVVRLCYQCTITQSFPKQSSASFICILLYSPASFHLLTRASTDSDLESYRYELAAWHIYLVRCSVLYSFKRNLLHARYQYPQETTVLVLCDMNFLVARNGGESKKLAEAHRSHMMYLFSTSCQRTSKKPPHYHLMHLFFPLTNSLHRGVCLVPMTKSTFVFLGHSSVLIRHALAPLPPPYLTCQRNDSCISWRDPSLICSDTPVLPSSG